MALYTASLNSGSNGNCYYIGNTSEAVLIDAGISCRETEKRMSRLGLNMKSVKGIFISHEHIDHIRGIEALSKKYGIPVYVNESTQRAGRLKIEEKLVRNFAAHESIRIGSMEVVPFPKRHDAADPYSFVVRNSAVCIGVMTDIGSACEHVINYFKQCNAVFLETNYDSDMLEEGPYPAHLKKRISSDRGHLSNTQAAALFAAHRPGFMSHLFLSHLSKENNTPGAATMAFSDHSSSTHIAVASRERESPLFYISGGNASNQGRAVLLPGRQTALF